MALRFDHSAGYGWVVGWACEVGWQAFFLLESPPGMWVCLIFIVGAFIAFGRTLLRLYGYAVHSEARINISSTHQQPLFAPLWFLAGWCSMHSTRDVLSALHRQLPFEQ